MSLPHLTWLHRERRPVAVETPGGVELEAHLDALDPFRNRMSLRLEAPSPPVDPGDHLRLSFGYAGQRWAAKVVLNHYPNRSLFVVNVPKSFEAADRRAFARWIPEDPVGKVVVRTALGEGWELQGPLRSLSEGGLALEARTVTGPQGEEARRWGTRLATGQHLPVVTLHLEDEPPFEAEGLVAWIGGDTLGLRLRGLTGSARERLRAYLSPRLTPLPDGLPDLPAALEAPDPDVAALPEAPPQMRERAAALRRLKRRVRSVVVAMRPGRPQVALVGFLEREGFGSVRVAETLAQWVEVSAAGAPDLVFIDGGLRELPGLAFVEHLQAHRGDRAFGIVLAQSRAGGSGARPVGVDRVVEKPYELDGALVDLLDEALESHRSPATAPTAGSLVLVMPGGPEREALEAFLLGTAGFQVRVAGTLAELVRAFRDPAPALALLDWDAEDLSSMDLAGFLAARAGAEHTALVVACPRGRPQVLREARELGAAQVLMRPYPLDGTLTALLRRAREGA